MLRCLIAYTLYYSGVLWIYAAIRLRGRAVALMYHRVLPYGADSFSTDAIIVSPESFERQMAFLKRHFNVLDAVGLRACLERGKFPDRSCVVTFDDGWYDNERHALPILARYGMPAIFFVATGYLGTSSTFWQEQLTRMIFGAVRSPTCPSKLLDYLGLTKARSVSEADARLMVREVVTRMKLAGPNQIEHVRRLLLKVTDSNVNCGDDIFMDWSAVHILAQTANVSVGSHAHSHVPLTQLGYDEALVDLLRSRAEFERRGLAAPVLVAYPNGDNDDEVVRATRDAGFEIAFTTQGGCIVPDQDWLRLPRINVHESASATRPEFMCRILGLF
jgi:peptidoglycan/xylan/chitin deacetylase (PgdA/CDA1 family)